MDSMRDAQAIIEFVSSRVADTKILDIKGTIGGEELSTQLVAFSTGNAGVQLQSVRKLLAECSTHPERRTGVAILRDLPSFVAHVNRFKDADSVLFTDPKQEAPVLVAVLDYHRAGADSLPRFGGHRARYAFPLSDEWKKWCTVDGVDLEQRQFAEFIEDQAAALALLPDESETGTSLGAKLRAYAAQIDTTFASPSMVIQLSRGLSVNVNAQLKSQQNLQSGESQLFFQTEHTDSQGKSLKVPGAFCISIPVFELGALHLLGIRLRYRVAEGKVTWKMSLYRRVENLDAAIREAASRAQQDTALPLLFGTPEG